MNNLADIAVLVSLNRSAFGARISDDSLTKEITDAHSTVENALGVHKNLFPTKACGKAKDGNAYLQALAFLRKCGDEFHAMTVPTGERNWYLLPAGKTSEFEQWTRSKQTTLSGIRLTLHNSFVSLKEMAHEGLNGTFKEADYPKTAEEFAGSFGVETKLRPIPSIDGLLKHLSEFEAQEVRRRMEAEQAAWVQRATASVRDNIIAELRDFAERLRDPEHRKFGNLLDEIRSLCEKAEACNFGNDEALTQLADVTKTLVGTLSGDVLNNVALAGQVRGVVIGNDPEKPGGIIGRFERKFA